MIVGPVESALFYRMQAPRSARRANEASLNDDEGDRFSRPGINALYLSADPDTAIAEFSQNGPVTPPGELLVWRVALKSAVRFDTGYVEGVWEPEWCDWDCDFRELARTGEREPPCWLLGDKVRAAHHGGIVFPSTKAKGTNLVVFQDLLTPQDEFELLGPVPREARARAGG